jgi:hypothetical protein
MDAPTNAADWADQEELVERGGGRPRGLSWCSLSRGENLARNLATLHRTKRKKGLEAICKVAFFGSSTLALAERICRTADWTCWEAATVNGLVVGRVQGDGQVPPLPLGVGMPRSLSALQCPKTTSRRPSEAPEWSKHRRNRAQSRRCHHQPARTEWFSAVAVRFENEG